MQQIRFGVRSIGESSPCFIIAEAGVNHNGDMARALALVDIAAAAGADAVKFQTFDAERLVTRDAPKAAYQQATTNPSESQYAMLKALELSADDHRLLMQRCVERGIMFLSTPFDEASADVLAELGVAGFKTPSGELTNLSYLRHVAGFGKPMIVSTGMATLAEVEEAVTAIEDRGNEQFALLHCVSNYPAEPETINLRAMQTLRNAFGAPVGYSDHTAGHAIALAAVALGARVIEKHFTQDRSLPGPDHRASLTPEELSALVRSIRDVEVALGDGRKTPHASERSTALAARKSLVLAVDVAGGDVLTDAHLVNKRPGIGLAPKYRDHVVGRAVRDASPAGTVLTWDMLA